MLCSLFEIEFAELLRRTMGCFFGCFRVRDDRRAPIHLLSQPISSFPKDPVESVAKNRLSSLLLREAEDRDRSANEDRKHGVLGSDASDVYSNELKAEAKFLKDCGTLPQTPTEIRNKKLKDSEPHSKDPESSKYHSWLQNTSIGKLKGDKQTSPIKLFDEFKNGPDSSSHSPDSCITGESTDRVENVQSRNKSVTFNCENHASSFSITSSSSEVTCQKPQLSGLNPSDYSVSEPSPYPTPLHLTNDMQTPGTVFPSSLHNKETRNNPRIRSQYVYPVEKPDQLNVENGAVPAGKELNVDTSLSSWLPPKQTHEGYKNRLFLPISEGKNVKTPGDRPILGMVAAHWNADEPANSPPKWWDGNGIPNSTNKYKEDQKVSWHATPFEERLEKALSEDKLTAERKQLGKMALPPINLDEKEESDTAGSKLQTSSNFESGFILINSS